MATLGDFSSVFALGFAVNGLLHYLDIDPAHRSRLHLLVSAIEDLQKQCKEKQLTPPPVSGDVSTEWAYQWIQRMQRQFWQRFTVAMSLIALLLLIWGAYMPTTTIPWWLSVPIVVAMFAVPLRAYVVCRGIEQALEDNIFDFVEVLELDARSFMASRAIVVRRPTDL